MKFTKKCTVWRHCTYFHFFQDHQNEVTCVTYNWNDCYIASGSLSGEIILHSVTTNLSSTPFGQGSNQVQYGFIQNKLERFWIVLHKRVNFKFFKIKFLKFACSLPKKLRQLAIF